MDQEVFVFERRSSGQIMLYTAKNMQDLASILSKEHGLICETHDLEFLLSVYDEKEEIPPHLNDALEEYGGKYFYTAWGDGTEYYIDEVSENNLETAINLCLSANTIDYDIAVGEEVFFCKNESLRKYARAGSFGRDIFWDDLSKLEIENSRGSKRIEMMLERDYKDVSLLKVRTYKPVKEVNGSRREKTYELNSNPFVEKKNYKISEIRNILKCSAKIFMWMDENPHDSWEDLDDILGDMFEGETKGNEISCIKIHQVLEKIVSEIDKEIYGNGYDYYLDHKFL